MMIKVGNIIFPIPTNGEINPPNRNPDAPKTADAAPVYRLPISIAMVEVDVKINPNMKSIANVSPS